MTHYRTLYEIAADNYGLITSAQAKEAGVSDKEMSAIAKRGRIQRVGRGVYRLTDYIPVENDIYAESVALVGEGLFSMGSRLSQCTNLRQPIQPGCLWQRLSVSEDGCLNIYRLLL